LRQQGAGFLALVTIREQAKLADFIERADVHD
jgi:hypothetical protein